MRQVITITSGVGPREARAFVGLLALRLEALCEARGLALMQILSIGEEHAPRSVQISVAGDAHRLLAEEIGTHALIARSDRRGRRARKRWFVGVEICDDQKRPLSGPRLDQRELEITACRAGGPGGQHVNKTSSAIHVRHRPSGISVKVADQRSQHVNRQIAVARIAQELQRRQEAKVVEDRARCRRTHYQLERGAPVREYRIDHRGRLEHLNGQL